MRGSACEVAGHRRVAEEVAGAGGDALAGLSDLRAADPREGVGPPPGGVRAPCGDRPVKSPTIVARRLGPESGRGFHVSESEADRFWSLVERGSSCWRWKGAVMRGGYGCFSLTRVRRGPLMAHRVAYAAVHGSVPSGAVVMHSCDNPLCVNPDHLRLGSQLDNTRDMMAKGRRGARAGAQVGGCSTCGASRLGSTQKKWSVFASTALCDECHRQERSRGLTASRERTRWNRMKGGLRVIPPSDFEELVTVVGFRSADVTARCFGIYDRSVQPRAEIARALGISGERIRQIVDDVQDRLLHAYRAAGGMGTAA